MEENRCIICGKVLHDPLAVYCAECEYELKRARLADEESVEEWIARTREEVKENISLERIKSLDFWINP